MKSQQQQEQSIEDYEILKQLGKGAYCEVVLAKNKQTGHQSAIKIIDKEFFKKEKKSHHIYIERDVLAILRHPGIIKLFMSFETQNKCYFSLELMDDGNFNDYMKRIKLDLKQIQFYVAEILLILEYIHQNGLVHRDLKPENLLLTKDKHLKLADFATAFVYDADKLLNAPQLMQYKEKPQNRQRGLSFEEIMDKPFYKYCRDCSFAGTSQYLSPELVNFNLSGPQADLWALGCLVYQLFTDQTPFQTDNEYQLLSNISNGNWKQNEQIPQIAQDLLKILLSKNPEERFNGIHIVDNKINYQALKSHQFFNGINFNDMWNQDVPKNALQQVAQKRRQSRFVTTMIQGIGMEASLQIGKIAPRQASEEKKRPDQIIMKGIVEKEHGVLFFEKFSPRCMTLMIQQSIPYLIYINPQLNNKKTTIQLNQCVTCKNLGDDKFIVCDKNKKKYVFKGKEQSANEWVIEINKLIDN